MRTVVSLDTKAFPPVLSFSMFGSPHRRMHISAIVALRRDLHDACVRADIRTPIDYPIDLRLIFVDPSSPDFGNIYLAFEQAIDGATLDKRYAIVEDDALVSSVHMMKIFTPDSRFDERGKTRRKGIKKAP